VAKLPSGFSLTSPEETKKPTTYCDIDKENNHIQGEELILLMSTQSQSQSHIATDGESVSSMSWRRAISGAHDQIFITL
jgi:hypothetical protein